MITRLWRGGRFWVTSSSFRLHPKAQNGIQIDMLNLFTDFGSRLFSVNVLRSDWSKSSFVRKPTSRSMPFPGGCSGNNLLCLFTDFGSRLKSVIRPETPEACSGFALRGGRSCPLQKRLKALLPISSLSLSASGVVYPPSVWRHV